MTTTRRIPPRIASLDGIRAVSIGLVLLGHASHSVGFPWHNWRFNALSNTGVRVFFVVSGYLITSLLMSEQERRGDISIRDFYVRRAYRILPAFYAYLLVVTALVALRLVTMPGRDLLFAYAYLSNFRPGQFHLVGHLWSLSVEEQFYLAWPAVMAFTVARTRTLVLITAVILPPILRCYMSLHTSLAPYVDQSAFTICDVLAIGCLLAVYRFRLHRLPFYSKLLSVGGVITLIAFCAALLELSKFSSFSFQITQSLLNVAIAILIDACIVLQPRFLNGAQIVQIGAWSYSIYLWQQLFCSATGHWWETFPTNIILSLGVAYTSYRWIEQPFLQMRKRRMGVETIHTAKPDLKLAA